MLGLPLVGVLVVIRDCVIVLLSTLFGEVPGGRRCRARRRRHAIPADPACNSEVVGEGAPVVARKNSLAVRETTLVVVLPGVPAAVDDRRAIRSGDVLCRRRVVTKERRVRRVHEQEGGCIRAPGVPSAGDRQATRRGIVLVLRSAPWSARVKRKDRNADILCRRLMCFSLFFSIQKTHRSTSKDRKRTYCIPLRGKLTTVWDL